MNNMYNNRYLILRRISQLSILLLFAGSNYFGWKILTGTLSSARVFETFYLTDPHAILQMLLTDYVAGTDALIGATIVFVFYALIGGRSFCAWVCPVNIITDTAIWLRKIFKLNSLNMKLSITRKTRYLILLLGLILSVITSVAAFETFNPITIIQRSVVFGIGTGLSVAIMILLLDTFILKNAWCRHLCPLGAFYSIISKIHIIRIYHNTEKCTNCNNCFNVCPEKQILGIIGQKNGIIASGECTVCGRCIEKCYDKALYLKLNKFKYK